MNEVAGYLFGIEIALIIIAIELAVLVGTYLSRGR